jgi:hypothetical protein
LSISGRRDPWKVLISIWRSTLESFFRLPLLVLGSVLIYAFLYAYWLHDLPFNISGVWGQIPYGPLHALIFAPLSFGVIQLVLHKSVRNTDVWKVGAISVGIVIIAHEWGVLALKEFVRAAGTGPLYDLMWRAPAYRTLIATFLASLNLILLVTTALLSLRLALLLPIAAMNENRWKTMLSEAWVGMRGHYVFSVAVSIAALFPMIIADHFLLKLYHALYMPRGVLTASSLQQWSAVLVWSANLGLGYIAIAALTACLYRAIETRRSPMLIKGLDPLPSKGADAPFSPGMKAQ